MKPSSYQCIGEETLTSASNATVVTANVPRGTSAVQITVETTSCRMSTVAASSAFPAAGDPTSATSGARIVQKDQQPWFMALAQGVPLKFASIAGTASVIQIAYLQ